jgi:DNA-binding XRE family transcriptional regulator
MLVLERLAHTQSGEWRAVAVMPIEQRERRPRRQASADHEFHSDAERAWVEAVAMTIRLGRARLRWSQAELAEHAGISRPTVSNIERGYSAWLVTYRRIAEALGMTLGEIIQRADGVVSSRSAERTSADEAIRR